MLHHATKKRADANGVTLEEQKTDDGKLVVIGTDTDSGRTLQHRDGKPVLDALLLQRTLDAEYPLLRIVDGPKDGWTVFAAIRNEDGEEQDATVWEGTNVPELADVLDACQAKGIDPDTGEQGERPVGGSVVPWKYREAYAERGNPNHCGDWLACQLDGIFVGPEGFLVEQFDAVLNANGVAFEGKWASLPQSGQKGWTGRYRMNGRLKLEVEVARNGKLVLPGRGEKQVPADELARLRTKHERALRKGKATADETA